jgi:Putative DNA-binding domain
VPYLPIRAPADLGRLVVNTTREDHWLEFKREPQTRNEQGRVECARDVAQFSNALGGVLLVGADEAAHVLSGWQAVPNPDDYIHWVDDVVKGWLTPVPTVEPHTLQVPGGQTVIALNIPPSLALIGRRQGEGFEFPIRAGDSRRFMTLMEVEARMQNKERAMRLRIEKIPQDATIGLDARVQGTNHHDWRVVAVDDDAVTLSRGALNAVVPLAYVEAVQRANEQGAEWMIGLSCAVQAIPMGGQPTQILVRKFNI